jgi:hypothetical protein
VSSVVYITVEAERNRVLDGLFRGLQQEVVCPAFGVAANGARSEKRRDLDGQSGFLHDLGNRANIVFMRARGAVGANLHLVRDDLARQRGHVLDRARARSRQPKIERVNAERLHQMKDFDLLLDGRIANRGRLQSIAQRFIGQQHRPRRMERARIESVPVVDEFSCIQRRSSSRLSALSSQ